MLSRQAKSRVPQGQLARENKRLHARNNALINETGKFTRALCHWAGSTVQGRLGTEAADLLAETLRVLDLDDRDHVASGAW